MKWPMLGWCLLLVSFSAEAQTRADSVARQRKFSAEVANAINDALPTQIVGDFVDMGTPRVFAHLGRANFIIPPHYQLDPTKPNPCTYSCPYKATNGDSAFMVIYLNPHKEAISFDVTKDFEVLDIDGVKHGIYGSQRLEQTPDSNTYGGPFTALFLGSFTMPYNERFPNREGHWAPDQFITSTTYPVYDGSKPFLGIQSIYIMITGSPALTKLIVKKLKYEALNELIKKTKS